MAAAVPYDPFVGAPAHGKDNHTHEGHQSEEGAHAECDKAFRLGRHDQVIPLFWYEEGEVAKEDRYYPDVEQIAAQSDLFVCQELSGVALPPARADTVR